MSKHQPVMLAEAIKGLQIKPQAWYVDATFGRGGHTAEILAAGGKVVAFDFDQVAIKYGQAAFASQIEKQELILIRENFKELAAELKKLTQVDEVAGVLFDLGTSTEQLTSTQRGISFAGEDEELDMRLDQRLGVKARDLLAVMSAKQLQRVFSEFGGEREARTIAKAIDQRRKDGQLITTVGELVELVDVHKKHQNQKIHPATKVFQALRIAVNDELTNFELALPQALDVVKPGGKIVTIAFHQGEDRLAKTFFVNWEKSGHGERTPKDVIKPNDEETQKNPAARSAKLRIFTKKDGDD